MTKTRYSEYPNHPLRDVPQEVLDIAHRVLADAVAWKDVYPSMGDPIADAVIAELIEAGYMIILRPDQMLHSAKSAMRSFDSGGSSLGSSIFTSLGDLVDYLEGRIDRDGDPVDES